VLVLHNRRIVESGTHDELMAKPDGFYAKLYGMQSQQLDILESDFAS
jgi:ABC-type multidrug transport system fused ATPase/permease subunit